MNEVFKLRIIAYCNLGIRHNFFEILFAVFIAALSQFGIRAQRLGNKHPLNSFHAIGLFQYSLKISENQRWVLKENSGMKWVKSETRNP